MTVYFGNKLCLECFLKCLLILGISLSGIVLSGCHDSASMESKTAEGLSVVQETVQIATDLDIKLLQPISDAYTEQTGVAIDWINIKIPDIKIATQTLDTSDAISDADVIDAIDNSSIESASTQMKSILPEGVDMLLMHSAYTLHNISLTHQLQPIGSDFLIKTVPKQYQDPDGQWYGLSMYARTLVYNRNKVNEPELINYAGLAAENWYGRLCMTSVYTPENQAILKIMLPYRGQKNTPKVLMGWITNMDQPSNDDQETFLQIEKGECDVGIVDSDHYWQYIKANKNTPIRLMWTNQVNRGAVTNTITAGLTKKGDNVGRALDFIEWLMTDEGQALLAFHTSTFPLIDISDNPLINMQAIRPSWTKFQADPATLSEIMHDKHQIILDEDDAMISNITR